MKKNKRRIKKYDDNLTSESSFLHPKWSIAPQFVESNNGWIAITSPEVYSFFLSFFFATLILREINFRKSRRSKTAIFETLDTLNI